MTTASVIPFPQREPRHKPERIEVVREHDGGCWLVLAPRGHGWLHGDLADALADAKWLATNNGVTLAILADLQPQEIQNVI
jgi:hypothetical protein